MNFIEFIENKKTLLAQYSFQYEEFLGKNDYLRSKKMTPHYRFTYEFSEAKPAIVVEFSYVPDKPDVLWVYYNSILSLYSPSGNNSVTSKHFTQEVKIDKFKEDVFEKWLVSQVNSANNFLMCEKKKVVERNIKKMEKDFK